MLRMLHLLLQRWGRVLSRIHWNRCCSCRPQRLLRHWSVSSRRSRLLKLQRWLRMPGRHRTELRSGAHFRPRSLLWKGLRRLATGRAVPRWVTLLMLRLTRERLSRTGLKRMPLMWLLMKCGRRWLMSSHRNSRNRLLRLCTIWSCLLLVRETRLTVWLTLRSVRHRMLLRQSRLWHSAIHHGLLLLLLLMMTRRSCLGCVWRHLGRDCVNLWCRWPKGIERIRRRGHWTYSRHSGRDVHTAQQVHQLVSGTVEKIAL
jgi:hypothetical protein